MITIIVTAAAMMRTINTATTPPMMASVLSELAGATVPPLSVGRTGAENA